ncbi:hypothetical protein CIPAW_11G053500 [Carya illinoinensis]|uniref:Uncharacterized protein n=1 Tax=Carya illinoinensis TaxID=32201 RepID=A0A8T1P149_CARIL|nr:hypothetical protein CIPAW_11G053500 [Carya illinoinensis]
MFCCLLNDLLLFLIRIQMQGNGMRRLKRKEILKFL